jgi:hypothetical protein
MKYFSPALIVVCFLSTVASLSAGEAILYGGFQKPGKISYSSATAIPGDLLEGDWGSVMGIRFSGGRTIGYEQNISYSPRFGKPGVKAFQLDSNLIVQAPGKIVPYVTAGIGYIKSWGQDYPTDLNAADIAAYAFSFGRSFSINYGGGLKVRKICGPLGINIDLRGYTLPDARDGTLNFIQTSAGAVISW